MPPAVGKQLRYYTVRHVARWNSPVSARPAFVRWASIVAALVATALVGAWFLQSTIPRHVVIASGIKSKYSQEVVARYVAILARDGVKLERRDTSGVDENARLLSTPGSGVDVAFLLGGVVAPENSEKLVMLASLSYSPLWVFYRGPETLTSLDQLRSRRVAVGPPGSGIRVLADPLLAANNVVTANTQLLPILGVEALDAFDKHQVDVVMLVGPVDSPVVWQALHDPELRQMSLDDVDAYRRRFPWIRTLTLPRGTIDLARHIPGQDVKMIGTTLMLAARADLPPAIIDLMLDAAHEIHGKQGYFEAEGEFPNVSQLDVPVSTDAMQHLRFGPSLLHRYLPFSIATYIERLIILLVPLLVVVVPIVNFLPQVLRWRVRSRIYRWYGQLALLERDVHARTGALPIGQWLADLDRIEKAAENIKTPVSYASEAYTLREHIRLVRGAVMAKAQ